MNLDWATFQLISDGAKLRPLPGHIYPADLIWTETGLLLGQPNEQLQPKVVQIP